LLPGVQQRRMDADVLADGEGPLTPTRRRGESELSLALVRGKDLLLVAGLEAPARGHDPDLQEVERLVARGVVLAVGDSAAGGHPLHLARPERLAVAHAVL